MTVPLLAVRGEGDEAAAGGGRGGRARAARTRGRGRGRRARRRGPRQLARPAAARCVELRLELPADKY